MEDNYQKRIDDLYLEHDHPELKGKSNNDIHEYFLGFDNDEIIINEKRKNLDSIIASISSSA